MSRKQPAVSSEMLDLKPLSPVALTEHEEYAQWMSNTITKNENIHNVALTSDHGLGKSSVLQAFKRQVRSGKKRILTISALPDATIVNAPDKTNSKESIETLRAELLKHIIYNDKPSKTPHSHYYRINSPVLWPIILAVALATPGGFLFYLGNSVFQSLPILTIIGSALLAISAAITLISIIIRVNGQISRIKFKNTEIDFPKELTGDRRLEDHIDEIIYFFSKTKYDYAIFEDIDRFKNPVILNELRQINILLNNSRQLNRKIVFIYTIKDSFLSSPKSRTKLFDLIIPVVPFISADNSVDYIRKANEELPKSYKLSEKALLIMSKNVSDMRILTDIFNEYKVFAKMLKRNKLELSNEKIFAMVILKVLYPKTFEDLRTKDESILHEKYLESKEKIEAAIAEIDSKERLQKELQNLGKALKTAIGNRFNTEINLITFRVNGQGYHSSLGTEFWTDLIANGSLDYTANNRSGTFTYGEVLKLLSINDTPNIIEDIQSRLQKERVELCNTGRLHYAVRHEQKTVATDGDNTNSSEKLIQELIKANLIEDDYASYIAVRLFSFEKEKVINYITNVVEIKGNDFSYHLSYSDSLQVIKETSKKGAEYYPCLLNVDILDYAVSDRKTEITIDEIIKSSAQYRSDILEKFVRSSFLQSTNEATTLKVYQCLLREFGVQKTIEEICSSTLADELKAKILGKIIIDNEADSLAAKIDISNNMQTTIEKALAIYPRNEVIKKFIATNNLFVRNLSNLSTEDRKWAKESGLFIINQNNYEYLDYEDIAMRVKKYYISLEELSLICKKKALNVEISSNLLNDIDNYIKSIKNEDLKEIIKTLLSSKKRTNDINVESIITILDSNKTTSEIEKRLIFIASTSSKVNAENFRLTLEHSNSYKVLLNTSTRPSFDKDNYNKQILNRAKKDNLISNYSSIKGKNYRAFRHKRPSNDDVEKTNAA